MLLIESESFIPTFLINLRLKYDNKITGCLIVDDYNPENFFNELIHYESNYRCLGRIRNDLPSSSKTILPYINIYENNTNYTMNKFYEFLETPFDFFEIKTREFSSRINCLYYISRDFLFSNLKFNYLIAFKVLDKKTRTFKWILNDLVLKKFLKLLPEKTDFNLDSILKLNSSSIKINPLYERYYKNNFNTILNPNDTLNKSDLFSMSSIIYAGKLASEINYFAF